jgi:hypothetical protein
MAIIDDQFDAGDCLFFDNGTVKWNERRRKEIAKEP